MAAYAKRNIAMLTTIGAMAAGLLLLIFFGAWAVSAGSADNAAGLLSGATAGFTGDALLPASGAGAGGGVGVDGGVDADMAPRLATAPGGDRPADTWWGQALLAACPLH